MLQHEDTAVKEIENKAKEDAIELLAQLTIEDIELETSIHNRS